ncbi:MAG: ATP-binding protein [Daejeonella sp.]
MKEELSYQELQEKYQQMVLAHQEVVDHLAETREQLNESTEILEAIRTGQVDAIMLDGENGSQVFTLKTADQTYRKFIEKMNEGAVTVGKDGIILYSNSSFATLLNTPLETIIGSSFINFLAEGDQDLYQDFFYSAWDTDVKGELSLLNANAREIPCSLSFTSLKLDEGLCMSIIFTDLSEHKRYQRLLTEQNQRLIATKNLVEQLNSDLEDTVRHRTRELFLSREHFKFLGDNIPVIAWTALPDGKINYYNKTWYKYTGLDLDSTRGWGWEQVVHPDDLSTCLNVWRSCLATGKPYSLELRYRDGENGDYRWYLSKALPYKNEKGEIELWFGTSTDIDDQKIALERKDEFIGIASHELKTPLTSLKGYLQLIESFESEDLHPTVKLFISRANNNLSKLQNLVEDLLNVSKINAGKFNFEISKISVTDLINQCVENLELVFPNLIIEKRIEETCFTEGNTQQLEQVLINLINNAEKYSPGSNKIVVGTQKSETGMVKVYVTDFGLGLSEDQKNLIFDRFYRIHNLKHFTSGLGMGLYISSNIINRHHGHMGVDSTLGEGSTFWFEIPVCE